MHNENPKDIFFHVGLARAASTYLQHKVFPHFKGVHYIPPNHYRRYQDIIAATTAPKYLVSREFDQRLESESRKFAHVFPEARIILVLRSSESWIASRYRQLVKNGYALSFPEFFDIEHDTGLWKLSDASMWTKIKIIETSFRHNPLVLFQEDLATAPFAFFDMLARFMDSAYDRERISLKPFHTSYSDKQLTVMLRVSKYVFSMHPTHGHTRWSQWVRRRMRLVACYGILYPAALVPAALVLRQPLIAPQTLEKIKDFFAEDWHRCQEYALQHNGAWSSLGVDEPTGH
jgi:hypothetical protein